MTEPTDYEPVDALYDVLGDWEPGTHTAQEVASMAVQRVTGTFPRPHEVSLDLIDLAQHEIDKAVRLEGEV